MIGVNYSLCRMLYNEWFYLIAYIIYKVYASSSSLFYIRDFAKLTLSNRILSSNYRAFLCGYALFFVVL